MNPKKVFISFGIVVAVFIAACWITLPAEITSDTCPEKEQSPSSSLHYEMPKLVPVVWLAGQ